MVETGVWAQGVFAEALAAWVREIAIVLVLAGVTEMVLPNTEMKRFGRMATGFLVVLVVSRPLVAFVGADLDPSAAFSLTGWGLSRELASAGEPAMGDAALDRGVALGVASRDRVLAAARTALETQIVALARRDPGVAEARAEVVLDSDPSSPSYGSLLSVALSVWMGEDGSGTEEPPQVIPVRPVTIAVEPIVVVDDAGPFEGESDRSGQPGGGALVDGGQELGPAGDTPAGRLARRLRSELVLILGVPDGGMVITVWPYDP